MNFAFHGGEQSIGKQEARKQAFKSHGTGDTRKKQIEKNASLRKGKRDSAILAKRVRLVSTFDSSATESPDVLTTNHTINQSIDDSIQKAKSNNLSTALEGLRAIRVFLCSPEPPIQIVIDNDLVPLFSNYLLQPNEEIQLEAAWCLTNLATGDHLQTGTLLNAVPNQIQILSSDTDSDALKEQVCWTIGNVAADSDEFREVLVANGCILPLIKFLHKSMMTATSLASASTAAWALSNLARGKVLANAFINTDSMPCIMKLLNCGDKQVSTEICWFFAFYLAKEEDAVNYLLSLDLREELFVLLAHVESSTSSLAHSAYIPMIRMLGNLSSGPIEWIDHALLLPPVSMPVSVVGSARREVVLDALLSFSNPATSVDHNRAVTKEALWVLANILGGSEAHRVKLLEHRHPSGRSAMDNILCAFQSDQFDIQRESLFALENACMDQRVLCTVFSGQNLASTAHLQQLKRLLQIPSDAGVAMSCIRILKGLSLSTFSPLSTATAWSSCCDELGVLEVLEDLQYTSLNQEVSVAAQTLVNQAYEEMERQADDEEQQGGVDSSPCLNNSTPGLGRGAHLTKPAWMS